MVDELDAYAQRVADDAARMTRSDAVAAMAEVRKKFAELEDTMADAEPILANAAPETLARIRRDGLMTEVRVRLLISALDARLRHAD